MKKNIFFSHWDNDNHDRGIPSSPEPDFTPVNPPSSEPNPGTGTPSSDPPD